MKCMFGLDFNLSKITFASFFFEIKITFAFNKSNFEILKVFDLNFSSNKFNSKLSKIDFKRSKNS